MPFVNETSNESPRFWIFWAITAPLTIVVFTIWFTWIWCKMPRMRFIVDSETNKASRRKIVKQDGTVTILNLLVS